MQPNVTIIIGSRSVWSFVQLQKQSCLFQVVVDVRGQQLSLTVLAVLEFNSDRKRMSVLCRLPDGRYLMPEHML